MIWYGISGSWRRSNDALEQDVRSRVSQIIIEGNGIVSGGALGVDHFATDEALKLGANQSQLKIILPTSKSVFFKHFRIAAQDKKITNNQAGDLIKQLDEVDQRGALITMNFDVCNSETYYARNM